ncbi:MAG: ABC transporter permease [Dehalococcoidia bacterium]|jgi:oligopeptide transport system permease protein
MQNIEMRAGTAEPVPPGRDRGLWTDALHRLARNKLAMAALVVLLTVAALSAAAQFSDKVRRYDPYHDQDYQHLQEGPSSQHFFGTDNLGRDNWSRVLTGVGISLQIGVGTQFLVLLFGLAVGVAAVLGGRTSDNLLMRLTDITYAFPALLFIILMRSVLTERDWPVLGNPRLQVMLAISLVNWTTIARLVRGQMLSLAERDYVLAARALGASDRRIVLRHMLPNTLGPVIVAFTFGIPAAIFAEAALGFIGFGLPLTTASLGRLVSDGYAFVQVNAWVVAFPSAAIALLMLCFTFLGDGLRDALDPQQR